jgi:hypothetical protein
MYCTFTWRLVTALLTTQNWILFWLSFDKFACLDRSVLQCLPPNPVKKAHCAIFHIDVTHRNTLPNCCGVTGRMRKYDLVKSSKGNMSKWQCCLGAIRPDIWADSRYRGLVTVLRERVHVNALVRRYYLSHEYLRVFLCGIVSAEIQQKFLFGPNLQFATL